MASNSSRSSGPMTRSLAVSPWVRAFPEERALPSGVLGPVLSRALAALADSRAADADMVSSFRFFGSKDKGGVGGNYAGVIGRCRKRRDLGCAGFVNGPLPIY